MLSAVEQKTDSSERIGSSATTIVKAVVVIPDKYDELGALAHDLKANDTTMKIDGIDPPEPDSNEGTEGNIFHFFR